MCGGVVVEVLKVEEGEFFSLAGLLWLAQAGLGVLLGAGPGWESGSETSSYVTGGDKSGDAMLFRVYLTSYGRCVGQIAEEEALGDGMGAVQR